MQHNVFPLYESLAMHASPVSPSIPCCSKLDAANTLLAELLTLQGESSLSTQPPACSESSPLVLPTIVRMHYVSNLLDWTLKCVSKPKQQEHRLQPQLWAVLVSLLASDCIARSHALPLGLLAAVSAVLQLLAGSPKPTKAGQAAEKQVAAATAAHTPIQLPPAAAAELLERLRQLLHLLCHKFDRAYRPGLDPVVNLASAALQGYCTQSSAEWCGTTTQAVSMLHATCVDHPNSRKVWDALVPRLYVPLTLAAFGPAGRGLAGSHALREVSKSTLEAAACNKQHALGV
jgi:hypothetical protein